MQANLGLIRTEFGRFSRQVSGYALEHLLPERGFDVTRFLVGSEGTLGVVIRATVQLSRDPAHSCLVVLGFGSLAEAADLVPEVLTYRPSACEGLDARIVDTVRARHGAHAVLALPAGEGWLFVELAGDDGAEVAERARRLAAVGPAARVITDAADVVTLWRLRADGAGYAAVALTPRPTPAGRTPRCRRSGWAPTCATSRPCWRRTDCTDCRTGISARAACIAGSTSPGARERHARVSTLRRGGGRPGGRLRRVDVG